MNTHTHHYRKIRHLHASKITCLCSHVLSQLHSFNGKTFRLNYALIIRHSLVSQIVYLPTIDNIYKTRFFTNTTIVTLIYNFNPFTYTDDLEHTVTKGETALIKQFHLLSQCFCSIQ